MNRKSFTLMELLVVIAILAVLATLIVGNFFTSLKKGRDAKRKTDLSEIQRALEMYYEDKSAYPLSLTFDSPLSDSVSGKVYMQKLPNDPITGKSYEYLSPSGTGADYKLFACLENNQQMLPYTSTGYSSTTMTGCGPCNDSSGNAVSHCVWGVSSTNISP